MAYKFSFADNGIYGADDLNNITKRLVTSGVADSFADGVPYNLSQINSAGECLYSSGVVPETVSTLKVTADNEAGTALIYPGTAFFADGAVIEIEAGGHELSFTPGAKHYVYLKNDLTASNTCYPACTQEAPAGDFVPLAEIEPNGTVTDTRTYAKGKLPGYQSNALSTLKISDSFTIDMNTPVTKTYQIGNNNYRYCMVLQNGTSTWGSYPCLGIYSFETGSYLSFAKHNDSKRCMYTDKLLIWHERDRYVTATITQTDGVLTLSVLYTNMLDDLYDTESISYTLYLF